jgi:hypothetical protein
MAQNCIIVGEAQRLLVVSSFLISINEESHHHPGKGLTVFFSGIVTLRAWLTIEKVEYY